MNLSQATKQLPCIRCGYPTVLTFFCPCDLHHPLCGVCAVQTDARDCAFMVNDLPVDAICEGYDEA